MLNWIRQKLSRRQSISRSPTHSAEGSDTSCSSKYSSARSSMLAEQTSNEKLNLQIIYEGESWIINADRQQLVSDLLNMATAHFFDPKDSHLLSSKFRFISVLQKRVLSPQCSVSDMGLRNDEEILLSATISTGATIPIKLTLNDIKGPSKEEVLAATGHLTKQNSIQIVPALDCQENFQYEIRKILYSLVEASAKILSQSPDAKVIFDGIAARINAKNKKEIDKNAIKYLKDLGFTEAQARYALRLKRNRQIEAMEWLLDNSHRVKEDNEDVEPASTSTATPPTTPPPGDPLHTISKLLQDIRDFHQRHFEPSLRALDTLTAMGFSQDDAIEALRVTGNNQVAACEWLCGERDPNLPKPDSGLDTSGPLYKALINNPAIQLGLHNPKIMLAFLSILENPSSANTWLNDVDTAPVLGQVFKTYHSEMHILVVNQQMEMMSRQKQS